MRVQAADVRVAADLNELGERAAEAAAATIRDVVESAGRCSLVLSDGTTPRGLYRRLASRSRDAVPWVDVHVFWSDERCVPHDDVRSNYRMARETLLDHVPCPSGKPQTLPASISIRHARGAVTWWLDRESAAQLDSVRTPSRSSTALPLRPVNDDDATD